MVVVVLVPMMHAPFVHASHLAAHNQVGACGPPPHPPPFLPFLCARSTGSVPTHALHASMC